MKIRFIKVMTLAILAIFSGLTYAQSKADINKMLDQFQKKGMFSKEQLEQARKELNNMDEQQMKALQQQAKQKMQDPKVQEKLKKLQSQKNAQ